jgi:hypothetical protein
MRDVSFALHRELEGGQRSEELPMRLGGGGQGTMLQAGRSRVRDPMRLPHFSIFLILPAAVGPRVHSVSNRIEYHKQENNVSEE